MKLSEHAKDHPLAIWLSASAMILGAALLISPTLGDKSASLSPWPTYLVAMWGAAFALGGLLSVVGLAKTKAKIEAAGMVLLSTAFAATAISAGFTSPSLLSLVFLGALAGGTGHRAISLMNRPPADITGDLDQLLAKLDEEPD